MNERKSNLNRKNRALTLCLALLLCLTLLWCGVGALGDGENTSPNVQWYVDDQLVDQTYVAPGNTPAHDAVSKTATDEYEYSFKGWTPDFTQIPEGGLSEPAKYTAVFEATKRQYKISWSDADNTSQIETYVNYGEMPTPPAGISAPTEDAEYSYALTWNPEITKVTNDATYQAIINKTKKTYTITFDTDGGTAIDPISLEWGADISTITEPTKTGYDFGGWQDGPQTMPKNDITLKATWNVNQYTITFNTDGGSSIDAITQDYGTPITAPADPTRENYTFGGWDTKIPDTMPAGDMTITAKWNPIMYTITWNNPDGSQIDTTEVQQGSIPTHANPTKAEDAQYTYTFAGWTPSFTAVTGDTTYTAKYDKVPKNYTVTFNTDGGSAIEPITAAFGSAVAAPTTNPTKDGYYFTGWDTTFPFTMPAQAVEVKAQWESLSKDDGTFAYVLSADKTTATITAWHNPNGLNNGELTVPAALENGTARVVAIGENVFTDQQELTSLTLPDTLESFGATNLVNLPALTKLTLRCTRPDTTLTGTTPRADGTVTKGDTINHPDKTPVVIPQPTVFANAGMAVTFTDILVANNADATNPTALTLGDYTVYAGHGITVEQGASLTNAGTLNNLGTITNGGAFTNNTVLNSCAGTVVGEITNAATATYVANGQHKYENNVCTLCGAELPKLTVNYTGAKIKKTYDKTRNVSLKKADFNIENGDALGVNVSKISASYNKADAGKRTVNVTVTLGGDNAALYGGKATVSLSAEIEPKELIITPTAGQKKTYGASDPKNYTGKVKGLLSGDSITGKLGRDAGENVGKYRITQGTISAGDNYAVEVLEDYFTIEAKSINSSDVGLVTIGNQRYTGQKVEPEITLKYGKVTLKQGTDFKAEFTDNVQPGMATVKLTGIGNYTGSRESSFRILNIASGVSSGSSGSGGGYSYGGFDDEDESDEDYEDEEEDAEVGRLVVSGEDYGTILFDASGKPSPFVQFEEEIELLQEGELTANPEEPLPWKLTIIADPMEDEETGETLLLDDGEREQYDELHLRLDTSLVDTLIEKGCTEIIYELDAAQLRVPLTSLVSEIELKDVASTEVVGTTEGDEGDLGDDVAVEEAVDEVEVALVDNTLGVAAYDICILQSEVAVLTQRELDAMNPYAAVSPAYELKVRAVLEGEEGATVTLTDDGETIDPSAAQRLPDYGWPVDLVLRMAPSEELEEPDEADGESNEAADETVDGEPVKMTYPDIYALFVSTVEDETVDPDVVTLDPAEFVDEDGLFYAEVHATGDGLYGVVRPAELAGENGETEDAGEELEDIGGSTASGLSSIGGSFTLDENGNPVLEN